MRRARRTRWVRLGDGSELGGTRCLGMGCASKLHSLSKEELLATYLACIVKMYKNVWK